mgnify:CR=1 FL=1
MRDTIGDGGRGKNLEVWRLFGTIRGFRFYHVLADHVPPDLDCFCCLRRTNSLIEPADTFLRSAEAARPSDRHLIAHVFADAL